MSDFRRNFWWIIAVGTACGGGSEPTDIPSDDAGAARPDRLGEVNADGGVAGADTSGRPDDSGAPERLRFIGRAALVCSTCPPLPDPSLSYQTPRAIHIGVSEVELLRSESDSAPHRIVTATAAVEADLVQGAIFFDVDVAAIPEGSYTHMRVKLDWIRFTVDATGHAFGLSVPGFLSGDLALSSYTDPNTGMRVQGDYVATYSAFGQSFSQSGSFPILSLPPSHPNGSVEPSNGDYRVTFLMQQNPIVITRDRPQSIDASVTFFIEDAFGWEELLLPSYAVDVFDIALDPAATERPAYMGVRGYAIDVLGVE